MRYEKYPLHEELVVDTLVTFLYSELPDCYRSYGERHNFWEFVYVDKGEIDICTDEKKHSLVKDDIIFYKPNQFHSGQVVNNSAPNLVIISFECASPGMNFFKDRVLRLNRREKDILSKILEEGFKSFSDKVDSPKLHFPKKIEDAPFASEHIIKNYIEILLIQLIRRENRNMEEKNRVYLPINRTDSDIIDEIIKYMEENIFVSLSPEDICKHFHLSRTNIMTRFKQKTGMCMMKFFLKLKIDRAKELVRGNQYNFTEISDMLGFSSVHYFSKKFKVSTGMTPTEYNHSVKAI